MKKIPPMPMGDGTYYQPGALYESGTAYVDALGQTVAVIGRFKSSREGFRLAAEVDQWVSAAKEGEQALLELDTKRQQQRLSQKGVARAYKDSDACAGGKRRSDCVPAQELAGPVFEVVFNQVPGQSTVGNNEAWAVSAQATQCADCGLMCVTAAQLRNNVPTGVVCFMNTKPPLDD